MAALPNLRIESLENRSGTTIKLAGELDAGGCAELLEHVERALAKPGLPALTLDLGEVSFIDSAGMRAIIVIERSADEREVALKVSPPPEDVTDLLQVTGIAGHVQLSPRAGDPPSAAPFIERVDIELPREPAAPGRARAELREVLRGRLPEVDQATATLLTSELVTNAVIHPESTVPGPIALRITTHPDRLRIEVTDAGAGFEAGGLRPRPREFGGHGLIVVEGLSSRWGTSRRAIPDGEGFCVWFELDASFERPGASGEVEPSKSTPAAAES